MEAYTPSNIEELKVCLGKMTPESKIIGGGTDYIIHMRTGKAHPDALCYCGHIKEMKSIELDGNTITIGSYATMTEMEHHPVIREKLPALMDSASDVGSLQIRNNATIGGNIGNASPASDMLPVLYLYSAKVEIMGPNSTRIVPIEEIVVGSGKTILEYNEVITKIIMQIPSFTNSAFVKLGSRKKVTIARIDAALGVEIEHDHVKSMKLFVGSFSVTPTRMVEVEKFMIGKTINVPNVEDVGQMVSDYIMNTSTRESRYYKSFASKGVIEDLFNKLER